MSEKNLENVSHEEAVAALKCTSDRVVLVVAKTDAPLPPPAPAQLQSQPLSQSSINLSTHVPLPPSPTPLIPRKFRAPPHLAWVMMLLLLTKL